MPAGCVRIDSALRDVPPAIFGEEVRLEFAARVRLGRRQRAAAIAKALTPSLPPRSNRRPKHVFYSSTAYTVHSPV